MSSCKSSYFTNLLFINMFLLTDQPSNGLGACVVPLSRVKIVRKFLLASSFSCYNEVSTIFHVS